MQTCSSSPQPKYRAFETLLEHEVRWRDRQLFLESKGYMLRPRLRPGWTPSWLLTGQKCYTCEDCMRVPVSPGRDVGSVFVILSLDQARPFHVDATRTSDDKLVYIKEVRTGDLESSIALKLSAIDDPSNHSVPILDTFDDAVDKSISYLVMPFLRLTHSPPFEVVEEVLDFADQILEVRLEHELSRVFTNAFPGSRFYAFTWRCTLVCLSSLL